MAKVIINSEEVVPSKKVKLSQHLSVVDIKKMIADKSKEQRGK